MAIRVPLPQTEIRPLGTPNAQLPQGPSQFRQVAAGIQNLAGSLRQVEQSRVDATIQLQVKRNTEMVFRAEQELADRYRQYDTQVREERRGTNASGLTQDSEEWWGENPRSIGDALENDAQRQAFSQRAALMRESALNSHASFEAQQGDIAFRESITADIASQIDFAAANFDMPSAIATARNNIAQAVEALAANDGWDDDRKRVEIELKNQLSALHKEVFENMVNVSPQAARTYFENNKGEINGSLHDQFVTDLGVADYRLASQQVTDALFPQIAAGNMSFDDARARAREELSGQAEDHALGLIDAEQRREDDRQTAVQKGWDDAANAIFSEARDIRAIPNSVWMNMTPALRLSLENQQRTPPERIVSDMVLRRDLISFAEQDPQAFAENRITMDAYGASNAGLTQFFDRLNLREQQELMKAQTDIRNGLAEPFLETTQRLNNATTRLDLDPEESARFDESVRREVEARRQAGENMTPDRIQEVVDRFSTQVTYDTWIPFNERDFPLSEFLTNPDRYPLSSVYVPGTDQTAQDIADFLRENGEEPTRERIAQMILLMSGEQ